MTIKYSITPRTNLQTRVRVSHARIIHVVDIISPIAKLASTLGSCCIDIGDIEFSKILTSQQRGLVHVLSICAGGTTYVEEVERATHFRFVVLEICISSGKIAHVAKVKHVYMQKMCS